ncbi:MAG: YdbL family protein [Gammaproteobacteria bacterium]|nr:YdbL family protein [Gammaproteobacteria bacterium]
MKKLLSAIFLLSLLGSQSSWGLDLGEAKSQGLIGETPSGYLEPVSGMTDAVKALIERINQQRREHYAKIAAENNTSLAAVESLAGQKAMDNTKPGNYVKTGGQWVKKK